MSKAGRNFTASERHLHLTNQPQSGLTIVEYCKQNNLSISTFDSWKRKARKESKQYSPEPTFIEILVPISNPIEIRCGNLSVSVPSIFDSEHLTKILCAMNQAVS